MGVNGIVNKCQRRGEEREGGEREGEGEERGGRRGGTERGERGGGGGEGGGGGWVAAVQCWRHYVLQVILYVPALYFCNDELHYLWLFLCRSDFTK